jgi:hypothetical protein
VEEMEEITRSWWASTDCLPCTAPRGSNGEKGGHWLTHDGAQALNRNWAKISPRQIVRLIDLKIGRSSFFNILIKIVCAVYGS